MEIRYRRDMGCSYMIFSGVHIDQNGYEIGMLLHNRIDGMLPLQVKNLDGEQLLYYDISGKQSISQLFRKTLLNSGQLEKLLRGLQKVLERAEDYMLSPDHFLLDPDMIYLDRTSGFPCFCYLPCSQDSRDEENPSSGEVSWPGSALARFLLKKLDHADKDAVTAGYLFYEKLSAGRKIADAISESFQSDMPGFLKESEAWEEAMEEEEYPGSAAGSRRDSGMRNGRSGNSQNKNSSKQGSNKLESRSKQEGRSKQGGRSKQEGRSKQGGRSKKEDRSNRKQESECRDRQSEDRRVRDRQFKSGRKKRLPVWFAVAAGAGVAANIGIDWWFAFDLTQIGGLAFGSIALLWLIYTVCIEKKHAEESPWEEFTSIMAEEDDDEDYYEEEPEIMGEAEEKSRIEKSRIEKSRIEKSRIEKSRIEKSRIEGSGREEPEAGEEDVTRLLTVTDGKRSCLLVGELGSDEPIRLEGEGVWVLGKSAELADICLPGQAVSRIHAQLEFRQNMLTITDLNSRNGTFVGDTQLEPNNPRRIKKGDHIRIADVGYYAAKVG